MEKVSECFLLQRNIGIRFAETRCCKTMDKYDYIIAGAGCAGLSLLHYIHQYSSLHQKKILIIDQNLKKSNDRTWCFWEEGSSDFESLLTTSWNTISIHQADRNFYLPTAPFTYKMIQGLDFYKHVIDYAKQFNNVYWQEATISSMETEGLHQKEALPTHAIVHWEAGMAKGRKVFSSILPIDDLYNISQTNQTEPFLWQHFKGHLIEFENPVFDAHVARLMDFNVNQHGATGFMYVLPLNNKKALVEYTLFSDQILEIPMYDLALNDYLAKHYPDCVYTIEHEEIGAIPMTHQSFSNFEAPIYAIGALGMAIKASTGYAFQFIQQQSKNIVIQLEQGLAIQTNIHNTRHRFYDAVLLHVLFYHKMEGAEIFKRIFAKNEAATVFKFLSNTSTLWEDIQIMRSLPTRIFLPAAITVLCKYTCQYMMWRAIKNFSIE